MSNYKHGIRTRRLATQLSVPITSDGCIQCVVGTAPVNLAEDPYDTVNKPFMFHSKAAAIAGLGYCTDFKNYTLCQSMYASFDVFAVAPIIMINVLDPTRHVKAELSKTYEVAAGKRKRGSFWISFRLVPLVNRINCMSRKKIILHPLMRMEPSRLRL